MHVGKEQATETQRCELENILKNHRLHSCIHTICCFTYVYKIISWHEKAEVPEQQKHGYFGPSFHILPLFPLVLLVISLFVQILFFCSMAPLSSRIGCLGDSNVAT